MNNTTNLTSKEIDLVDVLVQLFRNKYTIIFVTLISLICWNIYYSIQNELTSTVKITVSINDNLKFEMTSTTREFLESNGFSGEDFFNQYNNILLDDNSFYQSFNNYSNEEAKKLYKSIRLTELSKNSVSISLSNSTDDNELEINLIKLLNETANKLDLNLIQLIDMEIINQEKLILDLKENHIRKIEQKKSILEYKKKLNVATSKKYKEGLILEIKDNIRIARKMNYEKPFIENLKSDLYISDMIDVFNSDAESNNKSIVNIGNQNESLSLAASMPTSTQDGAFLYGYKILEEMLISLQYSGLTGREVKTMSGIEAELENIDYTNDDAFILGLDDLERKLNSIKLVRNEVNEYIKSNNNNSLVNWNINSITKSTEGLDKKLSIFIALFAGLASGSLFVLFRQALKTRE